MGGGGKADLEVGVVQGVPGVSERHPHRVSAVLRNGLL